MLKKATNVIYGLISPIQLEKQATNVFFLQQKCKAHKPKSMGAIDNH
jgi:hypothetical protein